MAVLPSKEELFELIVDSSTDFAIFSVDEHRAITSWNVGAERLFGFSQGEIIGSSADLIFTPEDRAAGAPEQEIIQARAKGSALDERWHLRKDGSRFWASGLMMPLRQQAGYVKITRDRTEQHAATQRLRDNEERFRVLATSIPQLVFRTLPDGTRTWGSPQWIDFTGLGLEESLGLGWLDAIHPEDRDLTRTAWQDARAKQEYYVEHRVRRAMDGEYRWHQTRAKPLEGAKADAIDWVGTMTDIHDLRGLQDRQQVLMQELQHRTRNLLAVVQSIGRQTIRSSSSLETFGAQFESRLRALSRVQSLLSRIDDQTIDLHTLVAAELAAHSEGGFKTGKIKVAGPPVPLPAMAAQALGLALHELATNAVKYGALAQPSGELTVNWEVRSEKSPASLALEWVESGVAMASSDAGRARKGYGSELIERALPYQLHANTKLDFGPEGIRCEIEVPLPQDRPDTTHG
jgi:PAS domain S-box-containing protein